MSLSQTLRFITSHPLNRHNPLDALVRFAQWQLSSRLFPGEHIHPWIGQTKFVLRPGETGLTGNLYCGLHEFASMAYVLHVMSEDDLFVDVGANVGSYTLLACGVRGARGYSFEPLPATYERLLTNVHINRLHERVTCKNIGIGAEASSLHFTTDMNAMNHVMTAQEKGQASTLEVPVSPLDELLKDETPQLIKIDVEGFETSVIKGAHQTLEKASLHSLVMEFNGLGEKYYGFSDQALFETLLGYGFRSYAYDPMTRALTDLKQKMLPMDETSDNTLLIRDLDRVKETLAATPKVTIHGRSI